MSLLGHVIRADNTNPMRQVAMDDCTITGRTVGKKRVGEPKMDWLLGGKKSAWNSSRKETDESSRRHPERRRKYKAKQEQEMQILEWAIDKHKLAIHHREGRPDHPKYQIWQVTTFKVGQASHPTEHSGKGHDK